MEKEKLFDENLTKRRQTYIFEINENEKKMIAKLSKKEVGQMEIEKLKALLCALQTGALSNAAETLGYTPSGISRMITSLEEETGFSLLRRGRNGVSPTMECEQMLPYIREIVRQEACYRQKAAEISGLRSGKITIGISYGRYYRFLSSLIASFCSRYPGVEVNVFEGTSTDLTRAIEERHADFCIISKREGDFEWIRLKNDEQVALVPADNKYAKEKAFPIKAFETECFIDVHPGQETNNSRLFAKYHIKPNVRHTCDDDFAAICMVEAGLGVSLVNAVFTEKMQAEVVVLPLDPPQSVEIGIALTSVADASPVVKSFIAFAKGQMQTIQ